MIKIIIYINVTKDKNKRPKGYSDQGNVYVRVLCIASPQQISAPSDQQVGGEDKMCILKIEALINLILSLVGMHLF